MNRFRRRPFRRRDPATSPKWLSTVFSLSALDINAVLTEYVLLDPATMMAAEDLEINRVLRVKRVVFNAAVSYDTQAASATQNQYGVIWACYVIGTDDPDATIITTLAGGILNSNRVIQTGAFAGLFCELAASIGTVSMYPGDKIQIDVRTNINLRQDEQLVCGVQFASSPLAVLDSASLTGISRVLVVPP